MDDGWYWYPNLMPGSAHATDGKTDADDDDRPILLIPKRGMVGTYEEHRIGDGKPPIGFRSTHG